MSKYQLRHNRFEHTAGTVVYDFKGFDYNLSREDQSFTGVPHKSVTIDPDGGGKFFTVPTQYLKEVTNEEVYA